MKTKKIKAIERLRTNLKNGKIRFEWRKMDKSVRKDNIKRGCYKHETDQN